MTAAEAWGDAWSRGAEPLSAWFGAPSTGAGVRVLPFEYTSRGDRVPGRLLRPDAGEGPFPTLLVAHDAGGAKDDAAMDAACRAWARRGRAVAAVDLPLHGERASAKLGARWIATLDAADLPGAEAMRLHADLARQARADLARALDAIAGRPELDVRRVGYAGFGLGARVGVVFCADDPRVAAVALAGVGAGVGPAELDPARHVGRLAPRPLLLVRAQRDPRVSGARARALLEAAGEPKRLLEVEGEGRALTDEALAAMGSFLEEGVRA